MLVLYLDIDFKISDGNKMCALSAKPSIHQSNLILSRLDNSISLHLIMLDRIYLFLFHVQNISRHQSGFVIKLRIMSQTSMNESNKHMIYLTDSMQIVFRSEIPNWIF